MPNTQNTRSQVNPLIIYGRNLLRQYNELKALGYATLWTGEGSICMQAPVMPEVSVEDLASADIETLADRRDNLVALINTYNDSSSPSVARTDDEHAVERLRARTALNSIKRSYIEGRDYRELSSGALWPVDGGSR